jgi:hypothetical protein
VGVLGARKRMAQGCGSRLRAKGGHLIRAAQLMGGSWPSKGVRRRHDIPKVGSVEHGQQNIPDIQFQAHPLHEMQGWHGSGMRIEDKSS